METFIDIMIYYVCWILALCGFALMILEYKRQINTKNVLLLVLDGSKYYVIPDTKNNRITLCNVGKNYIMTYWKENFRGDKADANIVGIKLGKKEKITMIYCCDKDY